VSRKISDHITESKIRYHKSRAKLPFEEKIKIIVELQKIDSEMRKKTGADGGPDIIKFGRLNNGI